MFLGKLEGPLGNVGFETTEAGFYHPDKMPYLSPKVSAWEVMNMIEAARDGRVIFD